TEAESTKICQSTIYGKTLSPLSYDVEQYIVTTARNTAVNNEDIAGMGAMFESSAFQVDIPSYAFYISEENATGKVEPFGEYSAYSKENYYREAASAMQAIVTDPYDFNGVKMVSYATPILDGTTLKGVVMADVKVANFSKVESTSTRYPTMWATIYDPDGQIIYDSENIADTGKNMSEFYARQDELASVQASMAAGSAFTLETTREDGRKVTRFFSPIKAATETWWAMTAVDTADVNEAVTQTIIWLLLLSVGALVLIVITTIMLLRSMLRPMQNVVNAAEAIASGDLNVNIEVKSGDEIGILSKSFLGMASNLKAIISDTDYLLGEMGNGNFQVKSRETERYVGDYKGLLTAIRAINTSLSNTLSQINQASDQVSSGSDQVSSGAQALSQGATEQASSVEELAATITEISTQVKDTAHNAETARAQTSAAGDEVEVCNAKMQEMITAMDEISNKSNEIGKIIKTI
ncbi:MAG: methyl-accepting chemotaxis protein, partial [Angelakisella sp.]